MPKNQVPIDQATKQDVYLLYNYQCAECGNDKHLSIHHKVPRRVGGSNDLENLVLLCRPCHNEADKQTLLDYPK